MVRPRRAGWPGRSRKAHVLPFSNTFLGRPTAGPNRGKDSDGHAGSTNRARACGSRRRGSVVDWARQARRSGLDSVWVHDSYYERDAISYVSAVRERSRPGRARGRLPHRARGREPVHAASGRAGHDRLCARRDGTGTHRHGTGHGLPLRLKQMGIPYAPESAVEGVSSAIDEIRALWAGERRPSATPGLPPIQPMFAPPHRIPIYIAAYRKEFVTLAGQKADGYLARPAESVPSLAGIIERLHAAPRPPAATRRPSRRPATSSRSSTRRAARRSTGRSASRS